MSEHLAQQEKPTDNDRLTVHRFRLSRNDYRCLGELAKFRSAGNRAACLRWLIHQGHKELSLKNAQPVSSVCGGCGLEAPHHFSTCPVGGVAP